LLDVVGLDGRLQGAGHGVLRVALVETAHFVAPPGKRFRRYARIAAFIDDVVDLAAESVERGDGAALFRWQEEERVVEAGTALGRFLLAVFVGRHRARSGRRAADLHAG